MVQREYIKCPLCGKIYQLKIQLDQNVGIFEWPISFECKDCGEILNFKYGNEGLRPKGIDYKPKVDDEPVTTIGYSSSLPITDEVYMKDLGYAESIVHFSLFMNLQRGFFMADEIRVFDMFLKQIQVNLLPYRSVLKELLPLIKRGNTAAFSKKMALYFEVKEYKPIVSPKEMFDAYIELIEKSLINLAPQGYVNRIGRPIYLPLVKYIDNASLEEVCSIKNALDENGKISVWYKEEALPYVAELLANIQKLIPAMIYASAGVDLTQHRGDLKIVTISWKDATTYYKDGYEVMAHGLKVIVGLNNLVENGDINIFTNPTLGDVDSIGKFAKKSGGKMIEHLESYQTMTTYLDTAMNNKVRNAASHSGGIVYDTTTQIVDCLYDMTDSTKVYETTLMDICRLCHIQLLHIMETVVLAYKIVEKAK